MATKRIGEGMGNGTIQQKVTGMVDYAIVADVIREQLRNAVIFDDVMAVLNEYLSGHDISLMKPERGYFVVYDNKEGKETRHALNLYKQRIVAAGDDKPQALTFSDD